MKHPLNWYRTAGSNGGGACEITNYVRQQNCAVFVMFWFWIQIHFGSF